MASGAHTIRISVDLSDVVEQFRQLADALNDVANRIERGELPEAEAS